MGHSYKNNRVPTLMAGTRNEYQQRKPVLFDHNFRAFELAVLTCKSNNE